MKIFGRRRRVSQSISTQTVPTFGSATNTSEETISPFASVSDGQVQRNTDDGIFKGPLTQDKGVGVNFDNIGVLYTPAASVSTNVDPPPDSPRDSMFEIGSSFLKDVGTSMTDLLPRERNETTSVSASMRNSLPRERDKSTLIYTPKKDVATSTSSPTERIPMTKDVNHFRSETGTSFSISHDNSMSPVKDAETSISFRPEKIPGKDAATSFSFPRDCSMSSRKDAETSFSFPRDSSMSSRKDAETSFFFPRDSTMSSRKDAETSFSFPRDSSMSSRKDAETSFSFPRDSTMSSRKDAETSFSFPRDSTMSPRKDAETSVSFPLNNSLTPRKDDATLLSQSISPSAAQNDAYNSLQPLGREIFSPRRSLETQGILEKPLDAPDTLGQWTHVDPNELAARLALMTWLAQPPTTTSTPASNMYSSATQTETELNLPETPDVPDNGELCVVGKGIKPPSKWAQRCRNTPIVPKSYPRQLKPKKKTSPYALAMNSDRIRHTKTIRRSMPFEAIIPRDHVILIQNAWGSRDSNNSCQVIIRPADRDSNCITVLSTRPNDNPPMSFNTTYRSDYSGFKGSS